jgi:hypothetical protein
MNASDRYFEENRGLAAFRSMGLAQALVIVALAGGMGRVAASVIGAGVENAGEAMSMAEELPPVGADDGEARPKTLYQQLQDDGSVYDTLKQTVSLSNLISRVSLVSLEGEAPKLDQRPMPFFDVDAACAAYPNAARHDCVAHEQKSYDATMAVWGQLSPGTIRNCANQASHFAAPRRYGALEQCVKLELAREEFKRKAVEPPPKFQYRGKFYAF